MFNFHKIQKGSSEIWEILLADKEGSDFEGRFGISIHYSHRTGRYHQLGYVISIPSNNTESENVLICCKNGLSAKENEILYEEIELLLGKRVYELGSDETMGWFLYEQMRF